MRILFAFLFGVAVAAVAYYATKHSLGGDAPATVVRKTDWPLPAADAPPNPLSSRLPDLRAEDPAVRAATWSAVIASSDLPHPKLRPAAWPLRLRILTHHVLWTLYRGRPFRSGGLELRVVERDDDPANPGARIVVLEPGTTGSDPASWPEGVDARIKVFLRPDAGRVAQVPAAEGDARRWPRLTIEPGDPAAACDITVAIELDPPLDWVVSNRLRLSPRSAGRSSR